MALSYGPHECLGREITVLFVTGLVKILAGLRNLRAVTGDMGLLESIIIGAERCYSNESWSTLTFDPTSKSSSIILSCI